MDLLRTVVPKQRWGIGKAIPAGWTAYFKGGWGSGIGLVDHQVALLTRGQERVSVAVLTITDGTHKDGEGDAARRVHAPPARAGGERWLSRAGFERGHERGLVGLRRLLGEEALGLAAAAELAQAAGAVLGDEVGQRAQAAGADAGGVEVEPLAVGVERGDQLADAAHRVHARDREHGRPRCRASAARRGGRGPRGSRPCRGRPS